MIDSFLLKLLNVDKNGQIPSKIQHTKTKLETRQNQDRKPEKTNDIKKKKKNLVYSLKFIV